VLSRRQRSSTRRRARQQRWIIEPSNSCRLVEYDEQNVRSDVQISRELSRCSSSDNTTDAKCPVRLAHRSKSTCPSHRTGKTLTCVSFVCVKVSEVYHLHRETYHLAIAYVDQYLSNTNHLPKMKLQLLGITSLFIAAKIEVTRQSIESIRLVDVC
jgi:hypothetical protein